jgi:hypothetical protein
MYLPSDLEKNLSQKNTSEGGLVWFPPKVDFGKILNEGIYCVPFVMTMKPGEYYSDYVELIKYKNPNIEIGDV